MSDAASAPSWINPKFAQQYRFAARLMEDDEGGWWQLPSVRDVLPTLPALARQMTYVESDSVEIRYPFLDRNLIEFLLAVPRDQLLRPGDRRSLMRRSLRALLPQAILARRTKASTGRCVVTTLEKNWPQVRAILSDLLISDLGYVDARPFSDELASLKNGSPSTDMVRLLRCLALEVWLRDAADRGILSLPVSSGYALGRRCLLEAATEESSIGAS
jgi:asparagine synthase (glutamine-hydrolysing)